ncbi:MAG: hemolysin XhlA family protein [Rhodobacteraceae bacterium]|nr:hemolysin XhlA family protein [Paracoccaceae bacterium]
MTEATQASLKRAHDRLNDHGRRLRALELNEAGAKEWREGTTKSLDEIRGSLKWVGRLIVGALILAFVAFVVSGGLNVAS